MSIFVGFFRLETTPHGFLQWQALLYVKPPSMASSSDKNYDEFPMAGVLDSNFTSQKSHKERPLTSSADYSACYNRSQQEVPGLEGSYDQDPASGRWKSVTFTRTIYNWIELSVFYKHVGEVGGDEEIFSKIIRISRE